MADFHDLRRRLRDARARREEAADGVARARERLRRLEAVEAARERTRDPKDPRHEGRHERLRTPRDEAEAALKRGREDLRALEREQLDAFQQFAEQTDPREAIEQLHDEFPILLLPVRLETRFRDAAATGGTPQLWVRIYPDDCSIDSFEAMLSEAEVADARAYWVGIWRAGGVVDQERGAWRGLVGSHGSGRAAWVVDHYRPLNPADKPTKASPTDVVLVVPTEALPAAAEATAVAAFWRAAWRADGDRARYDAARAALVAAVGAARATELIALYRPANFDEAPEAPLTRAQVGVSTAFVLFPAPGAVPTKSQVWTRPPRAALLPDRFVFLGFSGAAAPLVVLGKPIPSPLIVGPDPLAAEGEQLRPDGADLVVPEEMRWMVDFDRAVEQGMGLRIDLDATQAQNGFRRVVVLGLRLVADAAEAAAELEELIRHHHFSRRGFALVPQGTPTNNTEEAGAGFTRADDADASFDDRSRPGGLFQEETDPLRKADGQWLAESLGIDPAVLQTVRHAGGTDQAEARAMNIALWPATLGYWMEAMLHPVFGARAVADTRRFFTGFVRGRGMVPAVRIGDQPYGILPTTAFSRVGWVDQDPARVPGGDDLLLYLFRLRGALRVAGGDWAALAQQVPAVGAPGDAHQTLLGVLGLHPTSVEFAQRWAEGLDHLFNVLILSNLGDPLMAAVASGLAGSGRALLRRLGYPGQDEPDILRKFFFGRHDALKGPLVDDRPPSETEPIRAYTPAGAGYIAWLVAAARTSLDALRLEDGFIDGRPPLALLYLLLRHALQLGFYDAALRLYERHGLLTHDQATAARREAPFVHVRAAAPQSESRYKVLYAIEPIITGGATLRVGDFVSRSMQAVPEARDLSEQVQALERLAGVPTARLERALVEHIDCCSYRLDAWLLGLVHYQLEGMRGLRGPGPALRGVYLGAYAWLEDLRPEATVPSRVELEGDLAKVFLRPEDPPLMRDEANQGYIHAPSLNQAVAAAVLRNGYLSNASPANRQTLAVNLSSERIRTALGVLEGIRGGQGLSALLGYQFERGLHDRHGLAEVDKFIYDLRKAFPLRADRLASTRTGPGDPIEAIEARNVIDGLAFAEHVKDPAWRFYPFGKALPPATPVERAAIQAEVDRLLDVHDAVADLALAEGVYQAVLGNYDRAAGALEAFGRGGPPPEPEVVRTPSSGIGLTHRVGLHLPAGVDPNTSPVSGVAMTPRALAEPALNAWLAAVLPPLGQVGCRVAFRDAAGAPAERTVTLGELGVQPIDVLFLLQGGEGLPAMTELDDRVVRAVAEAGAPRPDGDVAIRYMDRGTAAISVFELMTLVGALRRLVLSSRPLRATDLAPGTEAVRDSDEAVFTDRKRVVRPRDALQAARTDLAAFELMLEGVLSDPATAPAAVLAGADTVIQQAATLLAAAARFAAPQSGWGFAYRWRQDQFRTILAAADELVRRWDGHLAAFDAQIAEYDALPAGTPDPVRFDRLRRAEQLISTTTTHLLPSSPGDYKAALLVKRAALAARRDGFAAVRDTHRTALVPLVADVEALLPISAFDPEAFVAVDEVRRRAATFAADLVKVVEGVRADLDRRLAASQEALAAHDAAAAAPARVAALQDGAKAIFGDDFPFIPEFALGPTQADELALAVAAGQGGELLEFLKESEAVDFPVDDWLYGVARVRAKMRDWEQVVMLAEGFGGAEVVLSPAQLPFRAGDPWLALKFPAGYAIDDDRLLYTAHYARPFDKTARQCGLLLDEWTEVIPSAEATTGLAFHHDRPNSEPPQVMLLVTPSVFQGSWRWDDLVAALNETLDLAKTRAVEPSHIDATAYARFLPATVMAATLSQLTISANLARSNDVLRLL